MKFLNTRSGMIRAGAIDLIEAARTVYHNKLDGTHCSQQLHKVLYHVGNDPRETFATAAAVEAFYE